MPRVKPITEAERRNAEISAQIYGRIRTEKTNGEEIAKRLGIGKNTFYKRVKHPDQFTLGDIRALEKIFPGIVIQ